MSDSWGRIVCVVGITEIGTPSPPISGEKFDFRQTISCCRACVSGEIGHCSKSIILDFI